MENELNDLVAKIETHFKECIWNSVPPIKEIDFNLVLLSQKIIDLRNNLNNIKNFDKVISDIMSWMEEIFHIPLIEEGNWMKQNKRNELVYTLYCKLSNLRTF